MRGSETCLHDPLDEILESVWMLLERNEKPDEKSILELTHAGLPGIRHIERLVKHGLLRKTDQSAYDLTEKGRERAASIIRRHRLAERLLVDVLNVRENSSAIR